MNLFSIKRHTTRMTDSNLWYPRWKHSCGMDTRCCSWGGFQMGDAIIWVCKNGRNAQSNSVPTRHTKLVSRRGGAAGEGHPWRYGTGLRVVILSQIRLSHSFFSIAFSRGKSHHTIRHVLSKFGNQQKRGRTMSNGNGEGTSSKVGTSPAPTRWWKSRSKLD